MLSLSSDCHTHGLRRQATPCIVWQRSVTIVTDAAAAAAATNAMRLGNGTDDLRSIVRSGGPCRVGYGRSASKRANGRSPLQMDDGHRCGGGGGAEMHIKPVQAAAITSKRTTVC